MDRDKLRGISKESRENTDQKLAQELEALHNVTRADLEKLRPQTVDAQEYEKLIQVVEEATKRNEDFNQFVERLKKSGGNVLNLGKLAAKMLTGL
jgi:uncharacterized tellurite resistance protein B-like protein